MYPYSSYRDISFVDRFFKHESVQSRISQFTSDKLFRTRQTGKSVQGREINCISVGNGKMKILVWSQMHGDEPTGTMAIFDLLNFFKADDDQNDLRNMILHNCTLHFIPMLNPDGAELYQRRNAQGIDINRDFLAKQAPETLLLLNIQEEIHPDFGFNLHDQSTLWSVSGSRKPAAISLLAPPVDNKGTITPARQKAIQVVTSVYNMLQDYIPGQIGRWNEEYEPRAVGETFQRSGISTILIEAGGFSGDHEKQYLRELNFKVLLHSFKQIAANVCGNDDISIYQNIPLNNKELFHLLIRNCRVSTPGGHIQADIGLNYTEEPDAAGKSMKKVYSVADFGDLSTWNAYEIIDAGNAALKHPVIIDARATFNIMNERGFVLSFADGVKQTFKQGI